MSKREYIYVQFNQISWRIEVLGEQTNLLIAPSNTPIHKIHESTHQIKSAFGNQLLDIVPAYHSIAVFSQKSVEEVIEILSGSINSIEVQSAQHEKVEIPICYELGLDLQEIAEHASMTIEEVINSHLSGEYQSLFIGFTPGFVYADGLDERLATPRKTNPRKKIEAGSVGIGGNQTGMYSLASPGGWNIIGRTPIKLFDVSKDHPMLIEVGTAFQFYRITLDEFESWEN